MARKRQNKALQEVSPNIESDPNQQLSRGLKINDDEGKDSTDSTIKPSSVKPHGPNDCQDALTPAPRSHLDRLPPEVLHIIFEELCEDEMPALRLQNKYLCEVATPHFLRSVDVRFKKTSIESLLELSKHPILSNNVKWIMYEPNMVEKKPRLEWEQSTRYFVFKDRILDVPPPPKQSASEREWRLFHRTVRRVMEEEKRPITQGELDLAWPIYQQYLQEQDVMISQNHATRDLLQAFQSFPNLTAVHINYGWGLWPGYNAVNPYEDGLCKAVGGADDDDGTARGLKEIMPLLKMLIGADLGLRSLRIGCLNWTFFEKLGDDGDRAIFFREMKQLMKPLQDFRLVITTWSDIDVDDEDADDVEDEEVQKCRAYLANGVLGRLVAAAPDLRKLAIEFDAHEIRCPIDFKFLVFDTHWPHLHKIKLDSVDAHENDWIGFFTRHAKTIKHISLSMIRLLEGEWADVLERMQQLLALKEFYLGYYLYGDDPEQFWSFAPPGYTSSKDDSVHANQLRWALEDFMVHGGNCPLRV